MTTSEESEAVADHPNFGAGTAFLQAGVVADSLFERCRKQPNFIRRHIHPTAQLAAWPMLEVRAQRAGLMVRSSAVSSADYAQTLKCWRQRFNDAQARDVVTIAQAIPGLRTVNVKAI